MGEDSGEKTEEPTSHKLREARKKGQILKSKEITGAALFFVSFFTLKAVSGSIWKNLTNLTYYVFEQIPKEFSGPIIGKILMEALFIFLLCVGPLFIATFSVALILEALQTQFLLTTEPLKPNFSKLNPIEGFKKFFSLKQYIELFKSLIKMALVIYILYGIIKEKFYFVIVSPNMPFWALMGFVGDIVMTTVIRVGMIYLAVALFDYFYQRYEFMKSMKMSKKEIKDEYKKLEGDPQIKQRQRDVARQMAMGRQMGAVPQADVVVTNPIHLAVAIKYTAKEMKAPMIVAKGKNIIAEQIKQIAEVNFIPIIENPELARALYKATPAGMAILPEYYQVVAEILAFVYNLKKKRKKKH
jgi:flagellar biosynthetic protein FlhB